MYVGKPKPCKICGVIGHTSINCFARRRRVIERGQVVVKRPVARTAGLKRIGKVGNKWLKFRTQWFVDNPPDENGYYHCYYCVAMDVGSNLTRREATLDHWLSRSRHPELRFDETNIVVACQWHNKDKGSKGGDQYINILKSRRGNGEKYMPY